MKDKEKLIARIMKECEKEGEPVTREEATEMAEMEIKASEIKNYTQSDKPRKAAKKERKPDDDKREIIQTLDKALIDLVDDVTVTNPEKEITFVYNNNEYSVMLVKHRPKKE